MISVLIPVYNEAPSLADIHREITAALDAVGRPFEMIFVNDGSRDDSAAVLDGLAADDGRVKVLHFRRNFGQTAALTAAIDHAAGDVLIPLDADGQNDPADIPHLLAALNEGHDVVSGWRKHRRDNALTRTLPSRLANSFISWLSGVRLHDYGCSLKAYRREVIAGVRLYGEMHRFVPIYAALEGARVTERVVNHRPRRHGRSNYGLGRVGKVLLDLLVVKFLAGYATKPIYFFGGIGVVSLLLGMVSAAAAVVFKLIPAPPPELRRLGESYWHKDFVETPLPVITAVLVLFGLGSVMLGLQAEILMRTYYESQGKRTYRIKATRNVTAGAPGAEGPG